MFGKFVILFVAVVSARAGYLEGGLRYASSTPLAFAAPSPIGFAAPGHVALAQAPISYNALPAPAHFPAVSRIEHLAPAVVSSYKTDVAVAPQERTYEIQPATVRHVAAPAPIYTVPAPVVATHTPFIASAPVAPLIRSGYLEHGLGFGGAHIGYPAGYATGYTGGYFGGYPTPLGFSKYGHY